MSTLACSPPTPTPEPTATPTATPEPTATPTEIPTPTATPKPTVWEIAEQMLAECAGGLGFDPWTFGIPRDFELKERYWPRLYAAIKEANPGLVDLDQWLWLGVSIVGARVPEYPSPFAFIDRPSQEPVFPAGADCLWYVLYYQNIPENNDGDGILEGEAFLFYEVGGTDPEQVDGEIREVRFTFPPAP